LKREAWAVVDLGFGDAGKGAITDGLVRRLGAGLVVRFNGGAQAGHNVVTPDGRHHTFSQFGAGHLAGAATLLGPAFLLHPLGMAVEAEHLARVGPDPWSRTWVDGQARLITPWQQAAGRAREVLRGAGAHGTCGVGVGECVADDLAHPDETLRAADLTNAPVLRRQLARQRDRKRAELFALGADVDLFDDAGLIDRVVAVWTDVARRMQVLSPDQVTARIAATEVVVFEGAQGVLLDETWGFHPHTTWSDTTFTHAHALCDRPLTRVGVTRAYGVRHGPGPFPTDGTLAVPDEHNRDDGFQGRFRTGALDAILLRYAVDVCGGVDLVALTHLDRVPAPLGCERYEADPTPLLVDGRLVPGAPDDLGHREAMGAWLRTVRPVVAPCDVRALVEAATGAAVGIEGWGPTAEGQRVHGGRGVG